MRVVRLWIVCGAVLSLYLAGCGLIVTDAKIKQMLIAGSRSETAFAGVNYTIQNGVVTLSGNCPTEKEKEKVAARVRHTSGVKQVVNKLVIAPVVLDADFPLKQAADSVLSKYPMVLANVQDSVVHVSGTAEKEELQSLAAALTRLQPKGLDMQVGKK